MSHKLGIIVPYRNRYSQLEKFLEHTKFYLDNRGYHYVIIVVEQDNASSFNRGMLCNIGFKEAVEQGCDYVVFHDVDLLPKKVDYGYADIPLHLATHNLPFDTYFGGVTLFPVDVFKKINGFSNYYWGWGFEDDDLLYRCRKRRVKLNIISQKVKDSFRSSLRFNGINSKVTLNNVLDVKKSFSIGIKVILEDYSLDHEKPSDKFTLVNIPGFDLSLHYSSFKRFIFEFFNSAKNYRQVYSSVKDNLENYVFVTYNKDEKLVKLFIDGIKVQELVVDKPFLNYNRKKEIYIGSDKSGKNGFKGCLTNFSLFDKDLEEKEVKSIFDNQNFPITQNYKDYYSNSHLKTYYDSSILKDYKLVDISGNGIEGIIENCELLENTTGYRKVKYTPGRRESTFTELKHESSGFNKGRWKSDLTRWNQLRYHNEVLTDSITKKEGLNTCEFTLYGKVDKARVIRLNVGI